MKRILTSFLAIILATANPIYLNTASAATVDSSYALDNHFSSDPTSMEFSAILDVKIEGSNAEVTFETPKNAVLSVILYDDKGTTVYACGSAEVSVGEKKPSFRSTRTTVCRIISFCAQRSWIEKQCTRYAAYMNLRHGRRELLKYKSRPCLLNLYPVR